jgi:hypothetical protein
MAVVSLTSNRMPAMGFHACHIRTRRPAEAALRGWSVFLGGRDRKAAR